MEFLVSLFSLWVFIKSFSYAMYEYKVNKNTTGAILIGILNTVTFIFLNIMLIKN